MGRGNESCARIPPVVLNWRGDLAVTYLPAPGHDHAPVHSPAQTQALAIQLHSLDAAFAAHIPEAHCAVQRHGHQFRLFHGIPRHLLDTARMSAQLGAVLDLRPVGVPYPKRLVCCAGGDQVPCWVPGYGSYALRARDISVDHWGRGHRGTGC